MFEKYSYEVKFKALLVVFVMLSIAAYKRSFGPLSQVINEHKNLSEKVENMNAKMGNGVKLRKEITLLDNFIGKDGTSKETTQQGILSFVTQQHSEVSIYDLQPIHVFEDVNFRVVTNQLDVTGNINELIQVVYDFEKNFNLSRIISINFYTTKKNNKSEVLHLKMIFQNYENNK